MVDKALSRMSLTEISDALLKRVVSSQEVVRNSLEELEKQGGVGSFDAILPDMPGTGGGPPGGGGQ